MTCKSSERGPQSNLSFAQREQTGRLSSDSRQYASNLSTTDLTDAYRISGDEQCCSADKDYRGSAGIMNAWLRSSYSNRMLAALYRDPSSYMAPSQAKYNCFC